MVKIITNKKQEIINDSIIYMDKVSVNFIDTITIYIISDEQLNSARFSFSENSAKEFSFALIDVNTNEITNSNSIELNQLKTYYQTKHIYQLIVSFCSNKLERDEIQTFHAKVDCNIETASEQKRFSFNIVCEAEDISERLTITLQNLKKYISEDYVTAFYETEANGHETDAVIYNQKIREYLLNIYELSALHGSYQNLFTALKYFGYGDLLELKELWTDGNVYKSTSIYGIVLEYLDKSLSGFTKTNLLSLVYQINKEVDIDDDGLPIYLNVLFLTDEILIKLSALKRVLENDFLHFNSHIVDIIGEFQTVVGQELSILSNKFLNTNINLNDNLTATVSISIDDLVFIENNSCFVEKFEYVESSNTDNLDSIVPAIDYDAKDIFEIYKLTEDEVDEFDALTRYYSGTFAIIKGKLIFDRERYQAYRTIVLDENNEVIYDTKIKNITFLRDDLLFGIRVVGKFSIIVHLIDHYNNITVCGSSNKTTVQLPEVEIFLGKYHIFENDENTNKIKLFNEWSTQHTLNTNNIYLVPKIDNQFDIMQWDQESNLPVATIKRKYLKEYDKLSTYSYKNQLNQLQLEKLKDLPLYLWGSTICVGIIDVIGDETIEGEREFSIRQINIDEVVSFKKYWSVNDDQIKWLSELIQEIKQHQILSANSIYNDFTYDISYYYNNDTASITDIDQARPMLRFRSIESSFKSRFIEVNYIGRPHYDFADSFFVEDVHVFSNIDSKLEFGILEPSISSLVIYLNEDKFAYENVEITNSEDLYDFIQNHNELKNKIFITKNTETIVMYSEYDIVISHNSFGIHSDVARCKQFKYTKELRRGNQIKVGQPIIATISNKSRNVVYDLEWTLFDEMTNKIINTQKTLIFKHILTKESTYSLELSYYLNNKKYTEVLNGSILCYN